MRGNTRSNLPLTAREVQVIVLACDGVRGKDIARQLHIQYATVKAHLRVIYDKLGATNIAQACALWVRHEKE